METDPNKPFEKRAASWSWEHSQILCPFYEAFDWVLGIAPNTESALVQDDLVRWNGVLLAPESSIGIDDSQQQAPSEEYEVTLLMKPVPDLTLEQDQQQILGPYSEELFDLPPPRPRRNSLLSSLQQTRKGQKPPLRPIHF
ncbi:unnamed protein product [Caretta caretta]